MIGCIVRITEDNINYDFLVEYGISLVGLCVKHDPDDETEEYLIEFPEENEMLHDGGDGPDNTRYWVDSELEIIEAANEYFDERPDPLADIVANPEQVRRYRDIVNRYRVDIPYEYINAAPIRWDAAGQEEQDERG